MKDILLELVFSTLKIYITFIIIYSFLPKRKKIEKIKKSLAKFHDKTEYVVHKRNLKQALNHRLVLKKWHRIIKFNQKS